MQQLSLTITPREVGAAAAALCTEKAERVAGFDSEGAAAFILARLKAHGPCSGEILTAEAIRAGFRPHDDRAFGPVFAGLSRRKQIVCVGYCMRQRGHGTAGGRVWGVA